MKQTLTQIFISQQIKAKAKSLFKQLDKRLEPKVFLLGLLMDDNRDDKEPIYIVPEDYGYKTEAFVDTKSLAQELEKVHEERNVFRSHPISQEYHDARIHVEAYREAINKILKREDLYDNTEKYVSFPAYLGGFYIFVVLELQKNILNKHYSLTKDKVDNGAKIYRSLIESLVDVFLNSCIDFLRNPNNRLCAIDRHNDELIREAGRQFMYTVSQVGNNFDGLHGLYDACNTIASLKYEGAEGLGEMIIAPKDHQNVKLTLQLKEPIKVKDYRKVRKFLELSDQTSSIISDSALIYGLGRLRGRYNPKEESLFVIKFINHFKWKLLHDNNPMMVVEYRDPSLPSEKIDREKFYSDLKRIFIGIQKEQMDDLWNVVIESTDQTHGTMLVISDNAEGESKRLGKQCFPLKSLKLEKDIIQQITSIDGSVLMDRNANCYAIGVILDGIVTEKGDASRGARYNSAIRYYEEFGENSPTVIVIVSEDGMINLIPNLMPQIKHSLIIRAIDDFKNISEQEEVDRKRFSQLMSFFQSVNFYLTSEECETINIIRKKIERKDSMNETFRPIYDDLKPNAEMNESYYLQE